MPEADQREPLLPVVCPACSCLCDDIEITLDASGQPVFNHACQPGHSFFAQSQEVVPDKYFLGSREVTIEAAVDAAADLLKRANMPLVTGLSGVAMERQQSAVELARCISGVVDIDGNPDRARQFAFQRTGGVTATLGEVRNRAELVLFWCFDPTTSHHRLLERCQVEAKRLVVVGPHDWTSGRADFFIKLDPRYCDHALAACHAISAQLNLEPESVLDTTGVPLGPWQELVHLLCQQNSAACFMGNNQPDGYPGQTCYDRLAEWVIQMNRHVRLFCLFPDQMGNRLAAEDVLAMNTGFPSAVDLSRQQPGFAFLEYATETLLLRQEVDAVVLFSGSAVEPLSEAARRYFDQIPKVVLLTESQPEWLKQIALNEGDVRVQISNLVDGDWARMDNVLLPVQMNPDRNGKIEPDFLSALLQQF